MKKSLFLVLIFLFVLSFQITVQAQVQQLISYQGYLTQGGTPVNGTVNMSFNFYTVATGGTPVNPSPITNNGVVVTNGVYNVNINVSSFRFAGCYNLEVTVGGQVQTPRILLTSAPYSLAPWTTNKPFLATNDHTVLSDSTQNVGIGTSAPSTKVSIRGKTTGDDGLTIFGYNPSLWLRNTNSGAKSSAFHQYNDRLELVLDSSWNRFDISKGIANPAISLNPYDRSWFYDNQFYLMRDAYNYPVINFDPNDFITYNRQQNSMYFYIGGVDKFKITPNGISTTVLEIRGGSDLAEPFEITDDQLLPAGSVVVIDENNAGKLTLSTNEYDSRVAGIISGAGGVKPGLTLKQEGTLDKGQQVAISGRVYCLVDAKKGAIHPGDLLTTSDTPGHAMKASDKDRRQGAVIGKAMSSLETGKGLVLVLVNLQ